jgi:hypothetical protein
MSASHSWSKQTYERSVTSRCWWSTPYSDGWDRCRELRDDQELAEILVMEEGLGGTPEWAQRVVERSLNFLPPCGHYRFPLAYLRALDAIGAETAPVFTYGCFTVDDRRKQQMLDYVFCLSAWLAGAAPRSSARELDCRSAREIDWDGVCRDLWQVLGRRTETKELLIERLIHSQRTKIKESPWDVPDSQRYCQDSHTGHLADHADAAAHYNYIEAATYTYDESSNPRIRHIEGRLGELCPDWEWFRYTIHFGWLCAPKAFRFLERLIWAIGKERRVVHTHDNPLRDGDEVPSFLRCEDLLPDQAAAEAWWDEFRAALSAWWRGGAGEEVAAKDAMRRLGEPTDVKRWLIRLMHHRTSFTQLRSVMHQR